MLLNSRGPILLKIDMLLTLSRLSWCSSASHESVGVVNRVG
jgi:hypothetical protein